MHSENSSTGSVKKSAQRLKLAAKVALKRMHSRKYPTRRLMNCAAIEVGSRCSAERKAKGGLIDASGSNNPHALKASRACDRVEYQMKDNTAHKYSLESERGNELMPIAGTKKAGKPEIR